VLHGFFLEDVMDMVIVKSKLQTLDHNKMKPFDPHAMKH
jgi:hypothetical protein